MMAIERAEHTVRHGWLKKKGEKRKNWNRRYAFLSASYLRYYDRNVRARSLKLSPHTLLLPNSFLFLIPLIRRYLFV